MGASTPLEARLAEKARLREERLLDIRARNALVKELNGKSWGASLTPRQAAAFAEYMRRFHLDISEIDNLGGRPYRNGRYYMRRIAEMASEGKVEWYEGEHIGPDERLKFIAGDESAPKEAREWAFGESFRRMKERIRLGVPPEAEFVYVVRVKMKSLGKVTEAVKWWTPDRVKKLRDGREVPADPVGDEHPAASTETRAWRRVGRLAAAEIPELRAQEEAMEASARVVEDAVIEEALAAEEEQDRPAPPVATSGDADPYGVEQRQLSEGAAPQPTDFRPSAARQQGDRITNTPAPEPDHLEADFHVEDGR